MEVHPIIILYPFLSPSRFKFSFFSISFCYYALSSLLCHPHLLQYTRLLHALVVSHMLALAISK